MADNEYKVEKVKGAGESGLETQAKFYEKLYGDKTPEEIQAAAKANYDKIHAKNVGNLIGEQQFNQSYKPKLELSVTTDKAPLPLSLNIDFGKMAAKVNDAVDKVQDKVQNVAGKIGDGVENFAQNIGDKVQDGLQTLGFVKDDDKNSPDAKKVVKEVTDNVTIGEGKHNAAKQTGISNLGMTVGTMSKELNNSHTVGKAADKVDASYANNGDDDASRAARGIGGNVGGASDNFSGEGGDGQPSDHRSDRGNQ